MAGSDIDKTTGFRENPYKDKPHYTKDNVVTLCDAKYVRLYDLQYREGAHYCDASRRAKEDLVALKSDEEFQAMQPDAVTIAVVVKLPDEKPKLLLKRKLSRKKWSTPRLWLRRKSRLPERKPRRLSKLPSQKLKPPRKPPT